MLTVQAANSGSAIRQYIQFLKIMDGTTVESFSLDDLVNFSKIQGWIYFWEKRAETSLSHGKNRCLYINQFIKVLQSIPAMLKRFPDLPQIEK